MSVCSAPSPTAASSLFIRPFSAKELHRDHPDDHQEIAVGRKYTDRKKRQPRTCSLQQRGDSRAGCRWRTGWTATAGALFSITRQKIGSD
jgi:hypothetical protein